MVFFVLLVCVCVQCMWMCVCVYIMCAWESIWGGGGGGGRVTVRCTAGVLVTSLTSVVQFDYAFSDYCFPSVPGAERYRALWRQPSSNHSTTDRLASQEQQEFWGESLAGHKESTLSLSPLSVASPLLLTPTPTQFLEMETILLPSSVSQSVFFTDYENRKWVKTDHGYYYSSIIAVCETVRKECKC